MNDSDSLLFELLVDDVNGENERVVFPYALVLVTIGVFESAWAVHLVVVPHAFITSTVRPDVDAWTVSLTFATGVTNGFMVFWQFNFCTPLKLSASQVLQYAEEFIASEL